jgi:DNA-binding SARP family transcriptional activator
LVRSFLPPPAQTTWSAAELQATAAWAGRLLDAAGHAEAALELHADAGNWALYATSMAAQAEGLLAQGRHQTVLDRLARIPDAERQRDRWLGYWEARALMATAADRALGLFAATHRRFAESSDVAGQLACGAAAVQTLWYARLGWSEITPWVDRLESLIAEQVAFPSRGVELLTDSALHAALAFCRPAHAAIAAMTHDLLRGIDDDGIDWNQRLSTATHLLTFLHNAVEHELVLDLIGKVDGAVEQRSASALNRAYWFIFRAMHDLRQADYDGAAARFERAEALARDEGLKHAEFAALQFHTYLDLTFRKVREAESRIARLEQHPARHHPDGAMNYRVAQTMCAQLKGNVRAAHEHAQRGLEAVAQIGAAYFQAVFPVLFASALADAGEAERALEIIATSRRLSRGTYLEAMEVQLLLEEAYIATVQGEPARALERLERGLALGAAGPTRAAYIHRAVTRKPGLLALALRHGIEVDFTRELIRRWRIPPPADEIAGWPWPIAVRTLGRFEVRVDDAPIEFGRKTPKKTLALLKAVIARGGSAPDSALIDTFWPDEEGDAAARSLGAAVHRLRGLLGIPEAVVQQGGQVALDRALVWVDAWAFERVLTAPHASAPDRDAAAATALALYGGTFLPEEEGEVWPVAMRERLRSRFVQSVSEHAARLEAAGRADDAIGWYLRGLDADNVVEPFYQGLMRCYHRLDRLPEAVSAYRRLKQTLSITLSLPPSAGTERLYQSLRLG